MTIRLPVGIHERIRTLMYTTRRSKQEIVEAALNSHLLANEE
jgi:predicted DNA-binding protein